MMSQPGSMRWPAQLGGFCARHAAAVLAAWSLAVALAAVGASRLPALLFSGSGDIPDSPSLRVDHLVRVEFADPYAQLLVLALRSAALDREPGAAAGLDAALAQRLRASPLANVDQAEAIGFAGRPFDASGIGDGAAKHLIAAA